MTGLPTIIAGRYRVLRELGRGGMGAVYLVEHVHTGEHLALKVLLTDVGANAEVIERFKREARAPARIRSDHVVRVTDADVAPELDGAPFLVMEALVGSDLEKLSEERGRMPPGEVLWFLTEIAATLDKAHSLGIVHRDLKPENLFLHTRDDGSTIVKILDFGISKMRAADGGEMAGAGLTKTGAVMGTPLYMSPEQARGRLSEIGPATDVWAIGLIVVNLLGGEVFWKAETIADLLLKIVVEPIPPPSVRFPWLGTRLDAWFMKSCAREPGQRWSTVGEQVRALAEALAVEGVAGVVQAPPISPMSGSAGPIATPSPMGRSTANVMARSAPAGTVPPGSRGRAFRVTLVIAVAGTLLLTVIALVWRSARSPREIVQDSGAQTVAAASTLPAAPSPAQAPAPPPASAAVAPPVGATSASASAQHRSGPPQRPTPSASPALSAPATAIKPTSPPPDPAPAPTRFNPVAP